MPKFSQPIQSCFNHRFKLSSLSALIGVSVLLACSNESTVQSNGTGGGTDAQARVQEDSQAVWVRFVDALTGEPITDELDVKFTDGVVTEDASGQPIGNGSLQVIEGEVFVKADFENEDRVSVLVGNTASGYLETGQQIGSGGELEIDQPQDIPVLRFTDAAIAQLKASDLAVDMEKTTVPANADGSIPAVTLQTQPKEFELSTQTDSTGLPARKTMGVASIQIEPGTRALDAAGNPIALTGDLTVIAVYFNPQQEDSLDLYPGGFRTPVENLPASLPASGEGTFISGGFAQFNILTRDGTPLTRFDRPLRLSIDMPKDILNVQTGQFYEVGDQFPIFSYEESTGVWTFEQFGLIEEKLNDEFNYSVPFLSTHLTSFNLDDYVIECSVDIIYDRTQFEMEFRGNSYYPYYIPEETARLIGGRAATRPTQYFLPAVSQNVSLIDFFFNGRVRDIRAVFYREGTDDVAGEINLGPAFCGNTYTFGPTVQDVDYTFNLTETQSCAESTDGVLTRVQLFTGTGSNESLYRTVASTLNTEWTASGQSQTLSLSASLPSDVTLSRLNVQKYVDGAWVTVSSSQADGGGSSQSSFDLSWTANDEAVCLDRGGAFQ